MTKENYGIITEPSYLSRVEKSVQKDYDKWTLTQFPFLQSGDDIPSPFLCSKEVQ